MAEKSREEKSDRRQFIAGIGVAGLATVTAASVAVGADEQREGADGQHRISDESVQNLAAELAKGADISQDVAMRVLQVLGVKKMVTNYETASKLLADERNRPALGLTKHRGPVLPEFSFKNLGLVMHDITAAMPDVAR